MGHTVLNNCILWDNFAPLGPAIALIGFPFPAELTVSYSDVEGDEAGLYVQDGFTLTWGDGNIDASPQFVDSEFRLSPGSRCIDAGDSTAVPVWWQSPTCWRCLVPGAVRRRPAPRVTLTEAASRCLTC